MSFSKLLHLVSLDKQVFTVNFEIANHIELLKDLISRGKIIDGQYIKIAKVEGFILQKIIDYCKNQWKGEWMGGNFSESTPWENALINLDMLTLKKMIHAANKLNMKKLLHLLCEVVTQIIERNTKDCMSSHWHSRITD